MVKYGVEEWKFHSASYGPKPPPHLVIYTNEITQEILDSIDTEKNQNIIFEIPDKQGYMVFDLQVELWQWRFFSRYIQSLVFRGTLVQKQFTAEHFEQMIRLDFLVIGATSYPLFENEDISKLPVVRKFYTGGYGTVKTSESLEKWQRKMKLNEESRGGPLNYYIH